MVNKPAADLFMLVSESFIVITMNNNMLILVVLLTIIVTLESHTPKSRHTDVMRTFLFL